MSPPRRRSARLASATPSRPKAASSLSALPEQEESPPSPTPSPTTPASSAIKPPKSEMHPTKAHPTANGDAGTWLGFRDIKSADVSRGKTAGDLQSTPSKPSGMPSTPFTFDVSRQTGDLGLSAQAQRIMDELRGDTARIKAELIAQRELEKQAEEITGRKYAKPRGSIGRFSAAHMAEFKKMDSIEGHASSFRAQAGRFTPVKGSLKRSPSKADLDDTEKTTPKTSLKRTHSKADLTETPTQPLKSALKRTHSKADLTETPSQQLKSALKRTHSRADLTETPSQPLKSALKRPASKTNLTDRPAVTSGVKNRVDASLSPSKLASAYAPESPSPVKRVRKQIEDDASTHRPTSRDGSSLPRPKSSGNDATGHSRPNATFASLMSPTKSSAARIGHGATPSQPSKLPTGGVTKSASKPDLTASAKASPAKPFGSLDTSNGLSTLSRKTAQLKNRVISPGRFDRVKSILKGARTASGNVRTAIPVPSGISQTPAPQVAPKVAAAVPFTTPRRKLFKRVDFTPDTKGPARDDFGEVSYPNLDAVLGRIPKEDSADITSPTPATSQRALPEPPKKVEAAVNKPLPATIPGAFTFRSDQTIRFGTGSPAAFGSSPGQSSIRTVRPSLPMNDLPGSFPPESVEPSRPNKETKFSSKSPLKPTLEEGVPHGLSNEKRARADTLESHPNKENQAPAAPLFTGFAGMGNEKRARAEAAISHTNKLFKSPVKPVPTYPHGLSNKKRARATDDEVDADQEGADRGGKRRRAEPAVGGTPAASMKLSRTTPTPARIRSGSATPTPMKKRIGMTMSRLNALAQPKRR